MLRGTDTEVLLVHAETGKFISSIGLIGGSKEYPMDIGNGCALQEDNVTTEFNTPPTDNVEEFIRSIQYNLDEITKRVSPFGLKLSITPSAEFDDDQLQNPAARMFGCEPDFNAWNRGKANPRPNAKSSNLRSAGGHFHVSVDDRPKMLEYVQAMDLFCGVPMVLVDKDKGRRELYGKAGAFRPKPYGFEYRTLSNHWISSEELIRYIWTQSEKAVTFIDQGHNLENWGELIQDCINNSEERFAEGLMKEFEIDDPR